VKGEDSQTRRNVHVFNLFIGASRLRGQTIKDMNMNKFIFLVPLVAVLAGCAGSSSYENIDGARVYFDYDSAEISKDAQKELIDIAAIMKRETDINIIVEGNTDARGGVDYNAALGALRAGNAAHVIMKDGVDKKRVKTVSFGKEKPSAMGDTEEAYRQNRNATIRISK
jgi:outer membrane protein OmpA-like peptidoglycan-associated protein